MPIRFRCPHCQQLLGIARRKAGSRVECPACQASVLVPVTDQEGLESVAAPAPMPLHQPSEEPLFEREDFERLFAATAEEHAHKGPAPPEKMPPPPPLPQFAASNGPGLSEPKGSSRKPAPGLAGEFDNSAGYLLTPRRASLLTVMVILLMAICFVGGLLVGRYLL